MIMNDRVTLLKRPAGTNAAGRPLKDWAPVVEVWANVRFPSGAEVLRGGAETSLVRASIRIRTRKDIDGDMRVRFKGVEYDVKSALPDSTNSDFMFVICEGIK
jgi:SPP1 family predicted phage head-tail adaptor